MENKDLSDIFNIACWKLLYGVGIGVIVYGFINKDIIMSVIGLIMIYIGVFIVEYLTNIK